MRTLKMFVLPVAAAFCLSAPALLAQNSTAPAATKQTQPQGKNVKFTLQNTTKNAISLQSGSQQINLAAGQSTKVKAPAGTKITTTAASDAGEAGTVIAEVADGMDGATVNVR